MVTIETKASTFINGVKYKLRSSQSPITHEFKDDMSIEFKEKNESIKITWEPFTVLKDPSSDTEAEQTVLSTYKSGLDLRVSTIPTVANIIISTDKVTDSIGAKAMMYNLPIMTVKWLEYIMHHHVDVFVPDITSKFMFRSNLASTRSELFKRLIFQSGDFRSELQHVIEANGGLFIKTNYDLLNGTLDMTTFMDTKFRRNDDYGQAEHVIYSNRPTKEIEELACEYQASVIGDEDLYRAIKDGDISSWSVVRNKKRLPETQEPDEQPESIVHESGVPGTVGNAPEAIAESASATQTATQWRRRRKIQKVDALAFLMPSGPNESQIPATQEASVVPVTQEPVTQEPTTQKAEDTQAQNPVQIKSTQPPEKPIPSTLHDDSSIYPPDIEQEIQNKIKDIQVASPATEVTNPTISTKRPHSPNASSPQGNKRKKFLPDEILDIEDLEFKQETEEEIKHKQRQEVQRIKKGKEEKIANSGLIQAITTARDQLSDSIKKELDIDAFVPEFDGQTVEHYIESKLNSMAIVETVDLRQKKPQTPTKEGLYKGRKNFKKFRKNMPLKSVVTRTFIGLESPERKKRPKEAAQREAQRETNTERQTEKEKMSDHNSSQSLFVDDESQPQHSDHSFESQSEPTQDPFDEDDDRNEDDMPKFAFTS